MAFAERIEIKRAAGIFHKRQLVADGLGIQHGILRGQGEEIERLPLDGFSVFADEPHLTRGEIIGAGEITAVADRPGHRRGIESERLFDFVQQVRKDRGSHGPSC